MNPKSFFDETAEGYDAKYAASKNPFLHHFFQERLRAATNELSTAGKTIWDIGAGTGQLYRHLLSISSDFDYQAVDVSSGMLAQSSVPADSRHVGQFTDMASTIPDASVDLYFMLGVTTYMSDQEIVDTLELMSAKAAPGARAVITITNRVSVECLLQKTANKLLSLPGVAQLARSESRVAGQNFERNFLTLDEFTEMLPAGMSVECVTPLNQTFTPLNRIAFKPSLMLERVIRSSTGSNSAIRRFFSSDLLMRIRFS